METNKPTVWYAGAILQGTLLGITLAIAIVEIVVLTNGAQIFRYQGF